MYVSYFLTYEVQELTTSDETDLESLKDSLWHPFKGLCFTTYTCVSVVKTFEYKYYLRFYGIRLDEISRMTFVCLCRWERINRTLSKSFQSPPCRAKPWARTTNRSSCSPTSQVHYFMDLPGGYSQRKERGSRVSGSVHKHKSRGYTKGSREFNGRQTKTAKCAFTVRPQLSPCISWIEGLNKTVQKP